MTKFEFNQILQHAQYLLFVFFFKFDDVIIEPHYSYIKTNTPMT